MLCQLFFGMTILILSLEHLNLRGSRLAVASVMLYHLASAGPASRTSSLHRPVCFSLPDEQRALWWTNALWA